MSVSVVIPTIRPDLLRNCLGSLAGANGPLPGEVVVVDDRPHTGWPLDVDVPGKLARRISVHRGPARGPAAARNVGWRVATGDWIAFLDDDVVVSPTWLADLAADLAEMLQDVAASQGRIHVPLPAGRRPTDWERNIAGLETARWATADMAYRRSVLAAVGGFDERFRRAYREDADLALRVRAAGHRLTVGERRVGHPPRPAPWTVSLKMQAGNRYDPLMRRLHGSDWRERAEAPPGRIARHVAVTTALALSAAAALTGHRRLAAAAAAGWLAGTADLAAARIAPGPRTPDEIAAMAVTSALLPPLATAHRLRGEWAWRSVVQLTQPPALPAAVLFDRDGTLVRDVPYNGDPALVEPMPGAAEAVALLRSRGVAVGVVSNQSGVGRGRLSTEQVAAVNARIDELVGPFDVWCVCPHTEADACDCRKPAPGLVREAARTLHVDPAGCVVIGDIGSDVAAAQAAGARGVLVPTSQTRPEEVAAAATVAPDLLSAARLVLGGAA
ncbi:MAG: HAD-IIIA family hydrolase [Pseudonocardiales bacterium]